MAIVSPAITPVATRSAEAGWEGKARAFLDALRPTGAAPRLAVLGSLLCLPLLVLALPYLLLLRLQVRAPASDA